MVAQPHAHRRGLPAPPRADHDGARAAPSYASGIAPGAIQASIAHLAVPIESLRPYPKNPNRGDVEALRESLRFHGQYRPITYNARDGVLTSGCILAGNHTYLAAVAEGFTHIAAAPVDVDDAEALRIVLTDNQTARLAEPDDALVSEHITTLGGLEGTGFDNASFMHLTQRLDMWRMAGEGEGGPGDEADDAGGKRLNGPVADTQVGAKPHERPSLTHAGDVVVLDGRHTLVVGDARDRTVWEQATAGHEHVQLVVTSPPYARQRAYDPTSGFAPPAAEEYAGWYGDVVLNILRHLGPRGAYALNLKAHCENGQRSLYVMKLVIDHVQKHGLRLTEEYSWVHSAIPGSVRRRLKNCFEPIYLFTTSPEYTWRPERLLRPSTAATAAQSALLRSEREAKGLRRTSRTSASLQGKPGACHEITGTVLAAMGGMAYPSNVLSLGVNRESWGHAAMFPSALPAFFIAAYSDEGDLVLDPFAGTGTTLLAAAELGRPSAAIELSPHYVDIAIERYRRAHPGCTISINGEAYGGADWAAAYAALDPQSAGSDHERSGDELEPERAGLDYDEDDDPHADHEEGRAT